ncbi:MAG: hypothetical protein RSC68_00155 [Acinetobacter sp.]
MKKRAGASSSVVITHENYIRLQDKLLRKPMFSKYYLVEITYYDDTKFNEWITKKLLASPWVQAVIYTSTAEEFETAYTSLKPFNVAVFDCYNISKELLMQYIYAQVYELSAGTIKLSSYKVDIIRRRVKYQEHILDTKLSLIANSNATIKTIESLIPMYKGVKLATFPYHFFAGAKVQEVASFMLRYKHNMQSLYEPLLKFVDEWLVLYDLYTSGQLSPSNYMEWMQENGEAHKIKYSYQMDRWMILLRKYSYERLITIKLLLEGNKEKDNFDKLFIMYKILRSVNL